MQVYVYVEVRSFAQISSFLLKTAMLLSFTQLKIYLTAVGIEDPISPFGLGFFICF